jgi:hypothetical protein
MDATFGPDRLIMDMVSLFTDNGFLFVIKMDNCVAAWENQSHGQNLRY